MNGQAESSGNSWSVLSIFLISVVVIAFQLLLLRSLAVSHYYHFTYLVISTALLGFGASGTFLSLFYDRISRDFPLWNLLFLFLFLLSIPATWLMADALPLDTQYLLYSWHQVSVLIIYNLLMLIPFLFGGIVIGFMITYYRRQVPLLYGANLAGSGMGGLVALGLMGLFPAYQLPFVIAPLAFLAMLAFLLSTGFRTWAITRKIRAALLLGAGSVVTLFVLLAAPPDSVDPYKDLSHFRELERQGDAEKVTRLYGPRAQIDVYDSPTFHYTLFAGPQATVMPPPQLAILMDGSIAAPLFTIEESGGAEILDFTPQALPLRMMDRPHVLLLGEVSGVNAWLAKRQGAESITVVQTNPSLIRLLQENLADRGGHIYHDARVEVIREDPRTYLQRSERRYDVIQFVEGEGMATGTGGLQGLSENFLLTREGVGFALERLTEDGVLTITRGIQSPPRDNIKIASLFVDAARQAGISGVEEHLLVSRNYLAANTLLFRSPVGQQRLNRFLEEATALQLDVEHYPGIRSEEIEQRNRIDGPEGVSYSYLHHAIGEILSDDPSPFYRDWAYQVRSPGDDSPYFYDFFKWDSLQTFIESYGDQWFQRLELGYVVLVITFLQLAAVAFLMILLPLLLRRRTFASSRNKWPSLIHFSMIGIGFMFLEMTFIQTFTRFLGDPVISAAAVICSILVFSGAGSVLQQHVPLDPVRRIRLAVAAILLAILGYLLLSGPLLNLFMNVGPVWRFAVSVAMLAPVSFFFGWMFPTGVEILSDDGEEELIPWAWGVDGFASVAAAPLAIILSMSFGFTWVILLGAGCYLIAGAASWSWQTAGR